MRTQDYLRIGFTLGLLFIVWKSAHWSVVWLLTLMSANLELVGYYLRKNKLY